MRGPSRIHACGIHAFGRREDALAYATERRSRTLLLPRVPERALGIAFGRVSGWGDAVRHTRGWRSQFAYPYDLSLLSGDRGMARALADRYAVETSPLSALG